MLQVVLTIIVVLFAAFICYGGVTLLKQPWTQVKIYLPRLFLRQCLHDACITPGESVVDKVVYPKHTCLNRLCLCRDGMQSFVASFR